MVYVVMTEPVRYNGSNEYRRIVVAEMNPPQRRPRTIQEWPRVYAGKTERCAFRKTLRQAIEISDLLQERV